MVPTEPTSSVNTTAASGVPKMAENTAAMPHMVIMRQSVSSRRSSLPSCPASEPPSSSPAPSRPAEPPNRWVTMVAMKINGAVTSGMTTLVRTATKAAFTDPPPGWPAVRYIVTTPTPASGSSQMSHGLAVRVWVAQCSPTPKAVPQAPTSTPTSTASTSHLTQPEKYRPSSFHLLCFSIRAPASG